MKLGILSDTHNEIANTRAALSIFRNREVEQIIHCGDLTQTKIIKLFDGWNTAFVFGNIDRERSALKRAVEKTLGPTFIGSVFETTLEGIRIGVSHGHDGELVAGMIESGEYDLVLHGHFHRIRDEVIDSTRVINPGALGGTYHEPRSVCVFDLITKRADFVRI